MKDLSFTLLIVWAILPIQVISAQIQPEFVNADFESSSTCDPTDCADKDISCVDGWWNYAPSGGDAYAWYDYQCNSQNICGGRRGILLKANDAANFLAATLNPYFGATDRFQAVSMSFLPLATSQADMYIGVYGSNEATNGARFLLGSTSVAIPNDGICRTVTISLFDDVNVVLTDFEFLVFGLAHVPPQGPPGGSPAPVVTGIIDDLFTCTAIDIKINEVSCGEQFCIDFNIDLSCFPFSNFGDPTPMNTQEIEVFDITSSQVVWEEATTLFHSVSFCFDVIPGHEYSLGIILGQTWNQMVTLNFFDIINFESSDCAERVVNSTQSWDNSSVPDNGIFQELRVASGATLTIESDLTLEFCAGGSLIVEQGAEVVLNGQLTSASCGDMSWQGVVVDGDGTSSQDYINGYVHGRFEGKPGSVIENAMVAIELRGKSGTGGIVKCEGTTFLNNQIGVRFSRFTNTAFFTSQPKPYNASFRNCDFTTDINYQINQPFVAFAWMWGVDGIPYAGCHFIRDHIVANADEVTDFGYGVLSIRSGFNLVSTAERDSYVKGLGYGVLVAQYSAVKPYYVKKAVFEDCYVGLAGSFSSFGTVVQNKFLMGTVPDDFNTIQSGIMLTGNQTGFEVQENTFRSNKTNATATIGIICDDLGDMNNVIRKNYFYEDLFAGNQAIRRNGVQNFELSRGLSYECNENYLTEASNQYGFDFFIGEYPSTTIRKSQNAFSDQGKFIATGNLFSRNNPVKGDFNATFELNFDLVDYFYFDDQPVPDLQKPKQYTGIDKRIIGDENSCFSTYCMPPCLTTVDLPMRKADFSSHQALLNIAIANNDTVAAIYHRSEMDDIAGLISQYYLYDTLTYSNDSLKQWYRNMEAITGQLLVSGQLMAEGDFSQAMSTINSISTSYAMSQRQIDGLDDLKTLYGVLNASKADSLTAGQRATVLTIANDDGSLASPPAKAVMMLNGYHFDPVYYLDVNQSRIVEPSQQDPLSNENRLHVAVYPNPATEELYISMEQDMIGDQQYVFELIDMQGKLVVQERLNNARLNVDLKSKSLVSGIYVYRIMDDDKVLDSGRVVIK